MYIQMENIQESPTRRGAGTLSVWELWELVDVHVLRRLHQVSADIALSWRGPERLYTGTVVFCGGFRYMLMSLLEGREIGKWERSFVTTRH